MFSSIFSVPKSVCKVAEAIMAHLGHLTTFVFPVQVPVSSHKLKVDPLCILFENLKNYKFGSLALEDCMHAVHEWFTCMTYMLSNKRISQAKLVVNSFIPITNFQ